MGDLFMTQFVDCIFNKDYFPGLGRDNKFLDNHQGIILDDKSILSFDLRTDFQVQKII
jgi:hypothetical protein